MPEEWSNNDLPRRRQLVTLPVYRDLQSKGDFEAGSKASGPEGSLNYLSLLLQHKWTIAGFILLSAFAGLAITLIQTPIYEARVSMEVQKFNQEFLDVGKVDPTAVNYEADSYLQTQMKMIQSDGLLDRVAARVPFRGPDANTPEPVHSSWIRTLLRLPEIKSQTPRQKALSLAISSLRIRGSGMTRLIEVYCDATDPQFAADFCNTLATEFLQQSLEVRWNSALRVTNWLTEQLAGLKDALQLSEARLNEFTRSTGVVSAADKDNVAAQQLAQVREEMFRSQADRVTKQSKYELAATNPADTLPEVLDDPSLRDYQMRFVDLRRQYAELSSVLTSNHPQVKRIEAQINELNAGLEHRRSNIINRVHNEYKTARLRESLLQEAYRAQLKVVADQASKNMQFSALRRDVDSTRELYESMLRRFKEAGIASAMRVSNIRVVDSAKPPELPHRPNRKLNLALGLAGGLFLGIAFLFVREGLDSSLKNPGDAKFYLRVPELGLIPSARVDPAHRVIIKIPIPFRAMRLRRRLPVRPVPADPGITRRELPPRVELAAWQNRHSFTAESYRSALTSVVFWGERENGKRPGVILVTSPGPQEGKTTTLTNLGISLAEILCESNRRVLLIDGDLRRPSLHKIFDLPATQGLCDLLRDGTAPEDCRIEDCVHQSEVPGLWVLPSGMARGPVTILIHSPRLPRFLDRFRREFNTILMDAPPMASLSDARVLARWTDAVLLVVRAGRTHRDLAMVACEQLKDDGAPLLGTILNDWNPKKAGASQARAKEYVSSYTRYYRSQTQD